jgi:hypothetical protein
MNNLNSHAKNGPVGCIQKIKTDYGTQVIIDDNVFGWITTRCNGKFGFIDLSVESRSIAYLSFDDAEKAFFASIKISSDKIKH